MIILSKEQVLKLHASLIKATGGSDGIRDEGMLDLALNNPFQSFGGKELYPSIPAKAARLSFGLVKNHAMDYGTSTISLRRLRAKYTNYTNCIYAIGISSLQGKQVYSM